MPRHAANAYPAVWAWGLWASLLEDVLDGKATLDTIDLIERTARAIKNSADCAIGFEAADMVLRVSSASGMTMWSTSSTAAAFCS